MTLLYVCTKAIISKTPLTTDVIFCMTTHITSALLTGYIKYSFEVPKRRK